MGMCATKKPVRRYANGGMLDNPLEAVMPFEPRQPATNPLQNQVNALDQKIAMGNAMDGLSNTERYQLANPTNAAYKPGSMMGGTSADASMQRQQNSILQSLRSGIAAQMPSATQSKWIGGGAENSTPSIGDGLQIGQPRRFADGGIVGLLKNRKKTIDDAINGAESPNAIVQANPPSAGKPSMGSQADDYAAQAAKLEAEQLAQARAKFTQPKKKGFLGFANGGIPPRGNQQIADGLTQRARFEGKGGPREDQIPVKVAGQNIKVSDGEEAMIIPAKTAANPDAMKAIMDIIRQTNDGREPGAQLKEGGKYAGGFVSVPSEKERIAAENQARIDADAQRALQRGFAAAPADFKMKGTAFDQLPQPLNSGSVFRTSQVSGSQQAPSVASVSQQGYAINPNDRKAMSADAPLSGSPVAPGLAAMAQTSGMSSATPPSVMQQTNLANRSIAEGITQAPGEGIASMRQKDGTVKNIAVGKSSYTDTTGNPTDDWTKTDRYAQAMQVNERMSNLARQMERDRYGRDMQADITNPKVIALAKLNLDRMNQEDEMQQQGIASGLDSRIKQNALAQSDQERQMIDRLNDPSLTPEQRISMRSDLLAMKGKNPNEHRYITRPNTKVYNDMGQIIGEEPGDIFDTAIGGPISGGAGRSQKIPAPKSKAEMDALPKGTRYTAPDGSVRVKP